LSLKKFEKYFKKVFDRIFWFWVVFFFIWIFEKRS
jgi:hypothetical protein